MKKTAILLVLLFGIPFGQPSAAEPDTLALAGLSRDTVDMTPSGWTNILPENAKIYSNYMVKYDATGPYINASAQSAASWIERDLGELDIRRYPVLEWDWKVTRFPDVEWERQLEQDDFAIRIEVVCDYPGGKWNILRLVRKGLITALFRGDPPVLVLSYVWSVEVPVNEPYQTPGDDRVTVIPIESGMNIYGRWIHERRDIRADLARLLAEEPSLVVRKIRIRCDTESSGTSAESGVRNIRLIGEK